MQPSGYRHVIAEPNFIFREERVLESRLTLKERIRLKLEILVGAFVAT